MKAGRDLHQGARRGRDPPPPDDYREGENLKGRLLAIPLGAGGKRVLGRALANTVTAIEARSYQTTAGNS